MLVWEPPSRLVLAWQITGEWAYDADLLTEVEVRFVPDGPDRTRVELEHRGLDAYGDGTDQMRDHFDSGWPGILEGFALPRPRRRRKRTGRMDTYDTRRLPAPLSLFLMVGGITVVRGVLLPAARGTIARTRPCRGPGSPTRPGGLFPVSILGLLASGAYLTSDAWTWSTPWIDVSIAGLVLVALQGPLVAGPRAEALKRALNDNAARPARPSVPGG